MRKLILLSATIFMFAFNLADLPFASKTIIKTIRPAANNTIVFDVPPNTVKLEPWKGTTIRLFLKVELPMNSSKVLNHLVLNKRYQLDVQESDGKIMVGLPNMMKKVMINKQVMQENIQIKAFIPSHITVEGLGAEMFTSKGATKKTTNNVVTGE